MTVLGSRTNISVRRFHPPNHLFGFYHSIRRGKGWVDTSHCSPRIPLQSVRSDSRVTQRKRLPRAKRHLYPFKTHRAAGLLHYGLQKSRRVRRSSGEEGCWLCEQGGHNFSIVVNSKARMRRVFQDFIYGPALARD